jgi:hypothetical protein
VSDALRAVHGLAERIDLVRFEPRFVQHVLDVRDDVRERVVDLVSDGCRQPAELRQASLFPEAPLRDLQHLVSHRHAVDRALVGGIDEPRERSRDHRDDEELAEPWRRDDPCGGQNLVDQQREHREGPDTERHLRPDPHTSDERDAEQPGSEREHGEGTEGRDSVRQVGPGDRLLDDVGAEHDPRDARSDRAKRPDTEEPALETHEGGVVDSTDASREAGPREPDRGGGSHRQRPTAPHQPVRSARPDERGPSHAVDGSAPHDAVKTVDLGQPASCRTRQDRAEGRASDRERREHEREEVPHRASICPIAGIGNRVAAPRHGAHATGTDPS